MSESFVHLQVHSEFSLVDGLLRIAELVSFARQQGMHSIALTDDMNMFATVKFYQECRKQGVKPVIGCDVYCLHPGTAFNNKPFRLTLIAKNQRGYSNLLTLVSQAYLQTKHKDSASLRSGAEKSDRLCIRSDWLADYAEGLIVLIPKASDVGQQLLADNLKLAEQYMAYWQQTFVDGCYLAVQRLGFADDELYLHQALTLAAKYDCPVVAVNNAHFVTSEDYEAHEARVCISAGTVLVDARHKSGYSSQQYLRSDQEMRTLFADFPELITNSYELAKMANLELVFGKNFLPDYPVPAG